MARLIKKRVEKPSSPRAKPILRTAALILAASAIAITISTNRVDAPKTEKTPSSIIGKESKPEFGSQAPLAEGINLDAGTAGETDSGVDGGIDSGIRDSGIDSGTTKDAGPSLLDAGISGEMQATEPMGEVIPKETESLEVGPTEIEAAQPEEAPKKRKGKKARKSRRERRLEKARRKRVIQDMMNFGKKGETGIPWANFFEEYAHIKAAEAGELKEFKQAKADLAKERMARKEAAERERLRREMRKRNPVNNLSQPSGNKGKHSHSIISNAPY